MLWTTIGVLSGLVLVSLVFTNSVRERWDRTASFSTLLIVWGANCLAGVSVFLNTRVEDFWEWKILLSTSAFIFVGLLFGALSIQRRPIEARGEASLETSHERPPWEVALRAGLGVAGLLTGLGALARLWIL